MDGSGNSKIRKFFKVETGKYSKFISLTLFSLCERSKSVPFFILYVIFRKFKKALPFFRQKGTLFQCLSPNGNALILRPFFCPYQVCLKCRKLVYESFSVNENSSAMSDNERLHLFAKDEKGYPFLSIGSCSDKTEKGTLFLSILLSFKTIGKGVKFQDITPIRATFTNTIASSINNRYPF